jgi:hypothetical protein
LLDGGIPCGQPAEIVDFFPEFAGERKDRTVTLDSNARAEEIETMIAATTANIERIAYVPSYADQRQLLKG